MPIPSLPNELVGQILSYECLEEEDLVKTCLVSRRWLRPSRKSLYNCVEFEFAIAKEVEGNPFPSVLKRSHRYTRKSWKLFSTLNHDKSIASLVKIVHLRTSSATASYNLSGASTTLNDAVSTILHVLPAAVAFVFDSSRWLTPQRITAFWPNLHRIEKIKIEFFAQVDWYGPLSRLANLRSLEICDQPIGIPGFDPSNAELRMVAHLQELSLIECSPEEFQVLSIGSEVSLRHLEIPLNVLPAIDLDSYPNLTTLSLRNCPEQPDKRSCRTFVDSLKSSSLRVLTLSSDACTCFHEIFRFGRDLPSTLTRINLDVGYPKLDQVLTAIKKSSDGSRIAQLGLQPFAECQLEHGEHDDGEAGLILIGIEAMLSRAQVELVWLSELV
ncbi:hypothetical protein JCM5350_005955 [Sporobolomyces pararoseus]